MDAAPTPLSDHELLESAVKKLNYALQNIACLEELDATLAAHLAVEDTARHVTSARTDVRAVLDAMPAPHRCTEAA